MSLCVMRSDDYLNHIQCVVHLKGVVVKQRVKDIRMENIRTIIVDKESCVVVTAASAYMGFIMISYASEGVGCWL